MTTPTPSASGAHTRVQLKRVDLPLVIHSTLATFDRTTGSFTAWLDSDPQGAPAETFTIQTSDQVTYLDSQGFSWQVVR